MKTHPQLMAYRSFRKELDETRAFADMGVKLRAFGICNTDSALGKPYSDYPPVWTGPGECDFAPLEAMVGDLLTASPDAEFICLLDLNTPRWLARKLRIDSFDAITHAAAMPEWREETKHYLRELVAYTERRWGGRIRAYSLMAGQTTEWFEWENPFTSSAPKDAAWHAWRKAHGSQKQTAPLREGGGLGAPKTTAPLQEGGGLEEAGGSTVCSVPPRAQNLLTADFEGVIYDPATEGEKIDWWRFHNSLTADALLEFAHVVREIAGDGKEIGAFFGYWFICQKGFGGIGHLDYGRVAASPDIDFFSSPATYTERPCGFATGSMAVAGTLRRHGKRLMHEIDFWPDDVAPPWKGFKYWNRPEETVAGNLREVAFALVNGVSWWWFDMWGGMFKNPDVRRNIAKFAKLHDRFAGTLPPPEADILVVADPDSACGMVDPTLPAAPDGPQPGICPDGFKPARGCGDHIRNVASRIGATYDTCSFDDLSYIDLSRIRLICLPATWTITPEKAKVLRDFVCRDGRTVLWTYAPGVSDGATLDADRIAAWAGVPFKTPGISTTALGDWTAAYAYDYHLFTPEAMRVIAEAAGCFLYTEELLPVCSNGRLIAVHCGTGGEKRICLRRRCTKVTDLMTGRTVAADCTEFTDTFASPDTKLYELG